MMLSLIEKLPANDGNNEQLYVSECVNLLDLVDAYSAAVDVNTGTHCAGKRDTFDVNTFCR